jgi:hypothetical protein
VVEQVDVDLRSVEPQVTPDVTSEKDFMKSQQSSMEVDIKYTMPNLNMVTSVFAVIVGKVVQHKEADRNSQSLLMKSIIFDKKPTKATQTDPERKPELIAPEQIPAAPKNVFRALVSMTDGVKNTAKLPTYETIGCQTPNIILERTPQVAPPSPEPNIDKSPIADLEQGLGSYITKIAALETTVKNLHHERASNQTKIQSLETDICRNKFKPRIEANSYLATQK